MSLCTFCSGQTTGLDGERFIHEDHCRMNPRNYRSLKYRPRPRIRPKSTGVARGRYMEILLVVQEGARRTGAIAHRVNVPLHGIGGYLSELRNRGWLARPKRGQYELTPEGRRVLEQEVEACQS